MKNLGAPQTISLASHPKFSTNTKPPPPLLRLFVVFCLWDSASPGGLGQKPKVAKAFVHLVRDSVFSP